MCGRTILVTPDDALRELFDLTEVPELTPRFNIAPSQPIALIREPHRLELVKWGVPLPGVKTPKINFRVESVAGNPATRDLARDGRCLVIVDGFFEWKHEGKARLPFLFRHPDGKPFAIGGVWAHGAGGDGCALITRKAEGVVRELHDRMPFVVPPADYARWLDPAVKVRDLLGLPADLSFVSRAVSTRVNSPANDDAACIEPPSG